MRDGAEGAYRHIAAQAAALFSIAEKGGGLHLGFESRELPNDFDPPAAQNAPSGDCPLSQFQDQTHAAGMCSKQVVSQEPVNCHSEAVDASVNEDDRTIVVAVFVAMLIEITIPREEGDVALMSEPRRDFMILGAFTPMVDANLEGLPSH